MIQRELVARLARRPGQKDERYRQLLGGDDGAGGDTEAAPAERKAALGGDLEARVRRLEAEVALLREELEASRGHH